MVAQTGALLAVDVGHIAVASTLRPPPGHRSQAFWFARAPTGAFVLATVVGRRDVMHVFIELLLAGIGAAACAAGALVCRMRRKRRRIRAGPSAKQPVAGHSRAEADRADQRQEGGWAAERPGDRDGSAIEKHTDQRHRRPCDPLADRGARDRWKLPLTLVEGIEEEAAVLLLLILVVAGYCSPHNPARLMTL